MSTSLKTNWIFYLRSSSKFWNFWKFEKAVFVVHLIYVYSRFDQHAAHIVVVLSRFDAVKAGFWAVGFDVGLCGQIPGRIHFQKYAKIWYAKIRSWNPKSNKKLLGFCYSIRNIWWTILGRSTAPFQFTLTYSLAYLVQKCIKKWQVVVNKWGFWR